MRVMLASLALAWGAGPGLAAAVETWIEVRTPNFTVVSNAGEGAARRTAGEFEQVRAAYRKVWPWVHLSLGKPTVIVAFKNRETLRRWAPGYFEVKGGIDVVSGSAYGQDRHFLLLRTDSRPTEAEVTPNYNLNRAYLDLALANSLERRLPFWLSNGLAEVLGNTSVQSDQIRLGRLVPWHFRRFNERGRMPLRSILDARTDSPLAKKEDDRAQFDAQSYVLVHYLLFGDEGAHAPALSRFQRLWQEGTSQDRALAEAFGDLALIENALPLYTTRGIVSYARLKVETGVESGQAVRVLPAAEVSALQAALHVAMDRPVEAQAAIREARSADARAPASYDAEGLLADLDRDRPRAIQAYEQAIALGSTSAHSHYRAAGLSLKAGLEAGELASLQKRLERAIELNASHADAYSMLAQVLASRGETQAAFASAEQSVRLEPGQSHHRIALARALLASDRLEEARKAAEVGGQLADDEGEKSNVERFMLYLNAFTRYAEARTKNDASEDCGHGDSAACARVVPGLEASCAAKDARACHSLASLYRQGGGVTMDPAKAAVYVQRACDAGDKGSCVEHAEALAQGDAVARDEPKAIVMLESLCNGNFTLACVRLALIHVTKPGAASRARSKALLARACRRGDREACSLAEQLR